MTFVVRYVHGLGDASPENVNEWIAPHVIRMAEARAVARAFRFATNVAMTAFEELGQQATVEKSGSLSPSDAPHFGTPNSSRKPKRTQEQYIRTLCQNREVPVELELQIQKLFEHKARTGQLPVAGASHVIDQLKVCPKKGDGV